VNNVHCYPPVLKVQFESKKNYSCTQIISSTDILKSVAIALAV
jgi:hypothetical protein